MLNVNAKTASVLLPNMSSSTWFQSFTAITTKCNHTYAQVDQCSYEPNKQQRMCVYIVMLCEQPSHWLQCWQLESLRDILILALCAARTLLLQDTTPWFLLDGWCFSGRILAITG